MSNQLRIKVAQNPNPDAALSMRQVRPSRRLLLSASGAHRWLNARRRRCSNPVNPAPRRMLPSRAPPHTPWRSGSSATPSTEHRASNPNRPGSMTRWKLSRMIMSLTSKNTSR